MASDQSEGQNRAILIGDNGFQRKLAKNCGLESDIKNDKDCMKLYESVKIL